jgi:cardiolipin synthase
MLQHKKQLVKGVLLIYILSSLLIVQPRQPVHASTTPSLLINEVMYCPMENDNTNEWIELYNPSTHSIDITGWMIADEKETDVIEGDETNGDGSTCIPPGGFAILTDKGTTLYDFYTIPDTAIRLCVDDSTLCGYGLNNQKEKILLLDSSETCIDAIEYGEDYDEVPGSPATIVSKGCSLGRSNRTDADDSSLDFFECTTPTPGDRNVCDYETEGHESENIIEYTPGCLLIIELYYHAYANLQNEFVRLFNPSNITIDLSGWYLTDEPWREPDDQPKLIFPQKTYILPNATCCITQNATAFQMETRILPDFEYTVDSHPEVPQLLTYRTFVFSNTGGLVGLYTPSNRQIDMIIFGETNFYTSGWDGPNIPSSGQGVILKRNKVNDTYIDTNTSEDWEHPRIYQIGQSEFPVQHFYSIADITTFVSPDNSFQVITDEIRNAQVSIDINMYEFTNPFLYTELVDALERNITIRIFMEGSPIGGIDENEQYILSSLASKGGLIRCIVSDQAHRVNARYQFDHAKYIIIDNKTLIVESCNWAKTGVPKNPSYGNREWGIIIHDEEIALSFSRVFDEDWNPERIDSYPLERMNMTPPAGFTLNYASPSGSYTPQFSPSTFRTPSNITPVFSPDTSEQLILDAIDQAISTIYIEQLYVYSEWDETISPFVVHLINKSQQGVVVKLLLDYNPSYEKTTAILNETRQYLERAGAEVKFMSTESSPFTTLHNKGMIIDNKTVLISSINWNKQSVRKNREAGILIENTEIAQYYATVFCADWDCELKQTHADDALWADYKYLVFIAFLFSTTFVLILRDWRKRKWR